MNSSLLYCDVCGAANRPNASFCRACGQLFPSTSPSSPTLPNRGSGGHILRSTLLRQRYRILDVLGQGGMGTVYKAADAQLGMRFVAVKEMSQQDLHSQEEVNEAAQAFRNEALMLAGLRHHHLPRIYDHFFEAGCWYLVMDYIEGETLNDHLEKASGGRLSIDEVLKIAASLCDVLGLLHNHKPPIIFRDLKPDNIMLTQHDRHLYLIDFGIARHFKTGKVKDTTPFISRGYSAPEQYNRDQTTQRSDIYSLGATLHELLSGDHPADRPFRFAPLQLGVQPSSEDLAKLISDMVALDESDRPVNMATIKEKLEEIAARRASEQSGTLPPQPAASPTPPPQPAPQPAASPTPPPQPAPPVSQVITEKHLSHDGRIWSVSWSPTGTQLATASDSVQIWDITTGSRILTYRGHSSDEVRCVAWSPNGAHIASASWDQTVQVWDPNTGNTSFIYRGHTSFVRIVAWSPDGMRIASTGKDKTVQIWNAATGLRLHTYQAHTNVVNTVAWSPDGTRLATAGHDRIVRVWEAATGNTFFSYEGHSSHIYCVAWSPDGTRVVSCGEDKTIQIWDAVTGSHINTFQGHFNWVYAVAWSPDSKYIVSASRDKTVKVWEANTGNTTATFLCQSDQALTAAWSPKGAHFAYSDFRGVWIK